MAANGKLFVGDLAAPLAALSAAASSEAQRAAASANGPFYLIETLTLPALVTGARAAAGFGAG